MQHTSVFVSALILLPLSRQTRGTFLYIIPEKMEKKEDVGGRECVEKKADKTERYGGGGQQKQQEREEER